MTWTSDLLSRLRLAGTIVLVVVREWASNQVDSKWVGWAEYAQ